MYLPFMTYATAIEVWVPTLVGGGDISGYFQCIKVLTRWLTT